MWKRGKKVEKNKKQKARKKGKEKKNREKMKKYRKKKTEKQKTINWVIQLTKCAVNILWSYVSEGYCRELFINCLTPMCQRFKTEFFLMISMQYLE